MVLASRTAVGRILASAALLCAGGCSSDEHAADGRFHDSGTTKGAPDGQASAGDGGKKCFGVAKSECAKGETCCFTSVPGTCTSLDSCKLNTQFACQAGSCSVGELCCGTFESLSDGGVIATTFCEKQCNTRARPVCQTSSDCPVGGKCTAQPEGSGNQVLSTAFEFFSVCTSADGGRLP